MSSECTSPEPIGHKTAAVSSHRLQNAKVTAENAMKVCLCAIVYLMQCHLLLHLGTKHVTHG